MSDPEGFREDASGQEAAGSGARRRAQEMRAQAEVAWARVQRSVPRAGFINVSLDDMMDAASRVPNESYVTGIAASLVTSAWLYAIGRRTASVYIGFIPPLAFILGLYARYLRLRHR